MVRHQGSDTRMQLAEVGACKDIGSVRIGVGVDTASGTPDAQSGTVALIFGANAATSGGDANWGVTAGLRGCGRTSEQSKAGTNERLSASQT